MATLIKSASGARCTASCHFARLPKCVCACGGRFHGVGYAGNLDDTLDDVSEDFFDKLAEDGADVAGLRAALATVRAGGTLDRTPEQRARMRRGQRTRRGRVHPNQLPLFVVHSEKRNNGNGLDNAE